MAATDADYRTTVHVVADVRADGTPVFESVLADRVAPKTFRLVCSPGLAFGLAAGDEFILDRDADYGYRIVKRGGNVCVQFFLRRQISLAKGYLVPKVRDLDGFMDGEDEKLLVFTIPAKSGFDRIEGIFDTAKAEFPGAEWQYGNVYDPHDGVTPLDWWK